MQEPASSKPPRRLPPTSLDHRERVNDEKMKERAPGEDLAVQQAENVRGKVLLAVVSLAYSVTFGRDGKAETSCVRIWHVRTRRAISSLTCVLPMEIYASQACIIRNLDNAYCWMRVLL